MLKNILVQAAKAYLSQMLFYSVLHVWTTSASTHVKYVSLSNMHSRCSEDPDFARHFPMQCTDIIRHPPADKFTMLVQDSLATFSLCGFAKCEEAINLRSVVAMAVVVVLLRSPVVARGAYRKLKRLKQ